jgi:ATP-dependent Clp protease ATP-binding subunit ClpA
MEIDIYDDKTVEAFSMFTRPLSCSTEQRLSDPAFLARATEILARSTRTNLIVLSEDRYLRRQAATEIIAEVEHGVVETFQGWEVIEVAPHLVRGEGMSPSLARQYWEAILAHAHRRKPPVFFFIEDIDALVGWGDIEHILTPYLARGYMRLVGTSTLAAYRQHIERNMSLQRWMQCLIVSEET